MERGESDRLFLCCWSVFAGQVSVRAELSVLRIMARDEGNVEESFLYFDTSVAMTRCVAMQARRRGISLLRDDSAFSRA